LQNKKIDITNELAYLKKMIKEKNWDYKSVIFIAEQEVIKSYEAIKAAEIMITSFKNAFKLGLFMAPVFFIISLYENSKFVLIFSIFSLLITFISRGFYQHLIIYKNIIKKGIEDIDQELKKIIKKENYDS